MFSRLFNRKPTLDHANPAKRIEALAAMDDSDQIAFLTVAQNDADIGVKTKALEKLANVDHLAQFLDDAELGKKAVELVCAKIDIQHPLLSRDDIRDIMLERISSGADLAAIALKRDTAQSIAETIFLASAPAVRQDAVALISRLDVLNHCERISRNKDKSIHRYVRDRLAEGKRLSNARDETLARAEQLIESATRTNVADSHYASLRDAQESSWESILDELAKLNDQLQPYGVEKLDLEMLRTRFPRRSKTQEEANADPRRFVAIIEELESADDKLAALEDAEKAWLAALRVQKAPPELSNAFFELTARVRAEQKHDETREQLSSKLSSLSTIDLELPNLDERDNWPKVWTLGRNAKRRAQAIERFLQHREFAELKADTQKEWREQLQGVIERCEAMVQRTDELFTTTLKNIEETLDSIQTEIQNGALKTALTTERAARNLILRLPEGARKQQFDALAPHSSELKQLLNWKSFAIRPKREELCEKIEALKTSPLPPQQQFDQVRALRAEWNELGPPSSREEGELQARYDAAAEDAWQICAEWFEQQKQERIANSTRKEALARELEIYNDETDWEAVDWRVAQQTLTQHLKQFKEIGASDRSRSRTVNKRFFKAYGVIRDRLVTYREGNAKAKDALIERAKETCADESLDDFERINAIKGLQAEWKAAGATFHRVEEKLWGEFRELCNSVFESQRAQREERKETITKNIEEAKSLVDQLHRKARRAKDAFDPNELREVEKQLADLVLPVRIKKDLDRKLAQVDDIIEDRKHVASQMQISERFKLLLTKDAELASYEASNSPIPIEWYDDVQNEMVWFESRSAAADESTLHDIVLRAEIQADIEPENEEDTARRLQLRVGDLNQTMGRGNSSKSDIAESLIRDWVGVAHGEQPLRERFNRAMNELLNQLHD